MDVLYPVMVILCQVTIPHVTSYNISLDVKPDRWACANYIELHPQTSVNKSCTYPDLFSDETNTCERFQTVTCGNRTIPKTPCQYLDSNCSTPGHNGDPLCVCDGTDDLNYDTCLTLQDGNHVWPARKWSPYYISCSEGRTFASECSGASVVFNFLHNECDLVYEAVNEVYNMSLILNIPDSLFHLIEYASTSMQAPIQSTHLYLSTTSFSIPNTSSLNIEKSTLTKAPEVDSKTTLSSSTQPAFQSRLQKQIYSPTNIIIPFQTILDLSGTQQHSTKHPNSIISTISKHSQFETGIIEPSFPSITSYNIVTTHLSEMTTTFLSTISLKSSIITISPTLTNIKTINIQPTSTYQYSQNNIHNQNISSEIKFKLSEKQTVSESKHYTPNSIYVISSYKVNQIYTQTTISTSHYSSEITPNTASTRYSNISDNIYVTNRSPTQLSSLSKTTDILSIQTDLSVTNKILPVVLTSYINNSNENLETSVQLSQSADIKTLLTSSYSSDYSSDIYGQSLESTILDNSLYIQSSNSFSSILTDSKNSAPLSSISNSLPDSSKTNNVIQSSPVSKTGDITSSFVAIRYTIRVDTSIISATKLSKLIQSISPTTTINLSTISHNVSEQLIILSPWHTTHHLIHLSTSSLSTHSYLTNIPNYISTNIEPSTIKTSLFTVSASTGISVPKVSIQHTISSKNNVTYLPSHYSKPSLMYSTVLQIDTLYSDKIIVSSIDTHSITSTQLSQEILSKQTITSMTYKSSFQQLVSSTTTISSQTSSVVTEHMSTKLFNSTATISNSQTKEETSFVIIVGVSVAVGIVVLLIITATIAAFIRTKRSSGSRRMHTLSSFGDLQQRL